jgi:hypothetical protein
LTGDFDDLDLDVDGEEVLAEWVDLDKTGVDRAFEASKSRYETDLTLVDGLEGVGAADTAGNGTAETDTFSQAVHQFRVPAVRIRVIIIVLDCCSIARLQVAQAGKLDIHEAVRAR